MGAGWVLQGRLDNFARGIAEALQERLKQPFNVDNRPGASEMIATQTVARSIPNGYTLLLSTESPLTTNQFLYERIAYSPEKDFTPISLAARVPMVFAASTNFPANDAKEFIEVAKRRQKNPVVIASSGVGGITHLPVAMLAYNEGFAWSHAPYRGVPPIMSDLISGRVDATLGGLAVLAPFILEKKIKGLAVQSDTRIKSLPHVPTFKELGIRDIQADFVVMISGPAGLPKNIADRISSVVAEKLKDTNFQQKYMEPYGLTPIGSTPEELSNYLASDRERQRERVKLSGAKLD